MDVEIHLLIGSTLLFLAAIVVAISQNADKLPIARLISFRRKSYTRERRIYPRYKTLLRVKYKAPLEEGATWIKDISRTGLRLLLDNPIQIGTLLKLEISVPYDPKPIFAQGNVVWMKEDHAGFCFDKVEQEELDRIMQHIGK